MLVMLLLGLFQVAFADPTPTPEVPAGGPRGAYTNDSAIGGGTNDLTSQLIIDAAPKDPLIATPFFDTTLAPWYDWKASLFAQHGIQFTLSYSVLGQHATDARPGRQDDAAGGVFDFGGTWTLFRRGSDWQGMLGFRISDQHPLGTSIAPAALGDEIGSAWGTSLSFDDISLNALELWWEQSLGKSIGVRLGKLDASTLFDPSALGNPFEQFLGNPFNLNSTIAYPAEGLGVVAQYMFTPDVSIVAAVVDANGNGSDWNFDSFFEKREHLKLFELAWTPEFSGGKGDYNLTVWDSDARAEAGVPAGRGYTVHGEQRFGNVMPLVRYGHSSGGAAALMNMVAVGAGFYHPFGRFSDGIGVGLSWGEPFGEAARDQYGVEVYYRVQITNEIAITPDIQYIIDPARNREVDSLVVFSLRARAAF